MEAIFLVIEDYRVDGRTKLRVNNAFSTYEKAQAYIRKKAPEYDPTFDDGVFRLEKGENFYIVFTLEVLLIDDES